MVDDTETYDTAPIRIDAIKQDPPDPTAGDTVIWTVTYTTTADPAPPEERPGIDGPILARDRIEVGIFYVNDDTGELLYGATKGVVEGETLTVANTPSSGHRYPAYTYDRGFVLRIEAWAAEDLPNHWRYAQYTTETYPTPVIERLTVGTPQPKPAPFSAAITVVSAGFVTDGVTPTDGDQLTYEVLVRNDDTVAWDVTATYTDAAGATVATESTGRLEPGAEAVLSTTVTATAPDTHLCYEVTGEPLPLVD